MTEKINERRFIRTVELRLAPSQEGKARTMVGHAALFNTPTDVGWFLESIRPGTFARSIAEKADVRALINHDSNLILGRTVPGTLRLAEDPKGLAVECDLPDTSYGRDLVVSMERGDVSQMSFGFCCRTDQWTTKPDGKDFRELVDVDLFDVAVVTFPAYEGATVAIRSKPVAVLGATPLDALRLRQLRAQL